MRAESIPVRAAERTTRDSPTLTRSHRSWTIMNRFCLHALLYQNLFFIHEVIIRLTSGRATERDSTSRINSKRKLGNSFLNEVNQRNFTAKIPFIRRLMVHGSQDYFTIMEGALGIFFHSLVEWKKTSECFFTWNIERTALLCQEAQQGRCLLPCSGGTWYRCLLNKSLLEPSADAVTHQPSAQSRGIRNQSAENNCHGLKSPK